MTEKYIVLSVVAAAIIIGIAALLTGKKHKSPVKKTVVSQPVQPVQAEEPEKKSDFDLMIEILEKSIGLEEHIYRSRYIPTASGKMVCIPALYLGPKGMMLFHYLPQEGWILGDKDNRWWTLCTSSDERTYIDNPIWECQELIDDLKKFLPSTDDTDYRIGIIFSNQCEIRSVEVPAGVYVGNLRQLTSDFKQMLSLSDTVYDVETVENLAMIFDAMNDRDTVVARLIALKRQMVEQQENKKLQVTGGLPAVSDSESVADQQKTADAQKIRPEERFTQSEILLRDALIIWRKQQADIDNVPVKKIFDKETLDYIVDFKPQALNVLKHIPGLDDEKIEKYGEAIIAMVQHAPV